LLNVKQTKIRGYFIFGGRKINNLIAIKLRKITVRDPRANEAAVCRQLRPSEETDDGPPGQSASSSRR
jgi:hypothetical protein